jgi:hypothetical protein
MKGWSQDEPFFLLSMRLAQQVFAGQRKYCAELQKVGRSPQSIAMPHLK